MVFLIGTFLKDNPEILYYLKMGWNFIYIVYLAYDTFTAKIKFYRAREQNTKSIFLFIKMDF